MARNVVAVSKAGFFARHWLGLLGAVVAGNALTVGAILFEPGPARAQPVATEATQAEGTAVRADSPGAAAAANPPEPAETQAERPLDLKLPGYLPPLKGMPVAATLPIGPDGKPMSPEVAEGFAMVEAFRATLDRLLGEFERAGRTTAAAEAFNAAFAAEAASMSQRAAKLDMAKLPDRDQYRLREHAEKVLMPLIQRMQASLQASQFEPGHQAADVAPLDEQEADLEEPVVEDPGAEETLELEEDRAAREQYLRGKQQQRQAESPDPLTRAILE